MDENGNPIAPSQEPQPQVEPTPAVEPAPQPEQPQPVAEVTTPSETFITDTQVDPNANATVQPTPELSGEQQFLDGYQELVAKTGMVLSVEPKFQKQADNTYVIVIESRVVAKQ